MIKSMTGYGRGSAGEYVVEIKSVNHRFLEMPLKSLRIAPEIKELVKKGIKETFSRGFFEISISRDNANRASDELSLDHGVVEKVIAFSEELNKSYGIKGPLSINTLLGINGIMVSNDPAKDLELEKSQIAAALKEALSAMNSMKEIEGACLKEDFNLRLDKITDCINAIENEMPRLFDEYLKRYRGRLRELAGNMDIDENRLAGEVAILADKSDISEEITRLKSHINQFGKALGHIPPVGKRLDFILQEMNREINTIGSKSIDTLLTEKVVETKTELERIREQVQNVE